MIILRDDVVVDVQSYYHHGEIDRLKMFVLDNNKFILERKLSNITTKMTRLKKIR